jgi:hypothetical protein
MDQYIATASTSIYEHDKMFGFRFAYSYPKGDALKPAYLRFYKKNCPAYMPNNFGNSSIKIAFKLNESGQYLPVHIKKACQ